MREKRVFTTNSPGTNSCSHGKNKSDPYLKLIIKLNLKWITHLNIRAKLYEENTGEKSSQPWGRYGRITYIVYKKAGP